MIITETLTRDDGATLVRRYSDAGYKIRQEQTGALYSEAVDVESAPYPYTETDQPVPKEQINPEHTSLEKATRFLIEDGLMVVPEQSEPDYFNENEPEPNYFNEVE